MYLIKRKNVPQNHFDRSVYLLIFIPMSSIFIILTFLMSGEAFTFTPELNWMVTTSAVFLLITNLLVLGINQYSQKKNAEFMDMQLLLQKESDAAEYYEMLLAQNENQSILIHDIKKHLQSIELLNTKQDHDKINAYIRQLMSSSDLKETVKICDNEMLNAILSRYQRKCMEQHISFNADIRSGTTNFIAHHNLTSLFCNLLDNAVEAAAAIPDSFVEITVHKKEHTPFIIIIVVNSCQSNPISGHDGVIHSKKSDNGRHGFGLKSIRKVVNQYQGNIQLYYNNETCTFHTIITLKRSLR